MELKGIENYLNNYIKENKMEELAISYDSCANQLEKVLRTVLSPIIENTRVHISTYGDSSEKGNLYLYGYGIKTPLVIFKIHRKKQKERTGFWHERCTYGVKSVELNTNHFYTFNTVEDVVNYADEREKKKIEAKNNRKEKFKIWLEEHDVPFNEFIEAFSLWNNMSYFDRDEVEKSISSEKQ